MSHLIACLLWALAFSAAASLPDDASLGQRAGAWSRSVALEKDGHVDEARAVLLRAWGGQPEGYEVTVRLAMLSLRLGKTAEAIAYYRRARGLKGAGPEATNGLANALTAHGYALLADGDAKHARQHFREALGVDKQQDSARQGLLAARSRPFEPELWGAYVGLFGEGGGHGGAVYLSLPVRPVDAWTLRASYRLIAMRIDATDAADDVSRGMGARSSPSVSTSAPWSQHEFYGSVAYDARLIGLEGMALALLTGDEGFVPGQAARLRLGWRYGLSVEEALLFRSAGTNLQLTPAVFGWPWRQFGIAAGAHLTVDEVGVDASARLGLSFISNPYSVHLSGHLGTERWPLNMTTNSVLSTASAVEAGGSLATWLALSDSFSWGLQGSLDSLRSDGATLTHVTVGTGLRWSPIWEDD